MSPAGSSAGAGSPSGLGKLLRVAKCTRTRRRVVATGHTARRGNLLPRVTSSWQHDPNASSITFNHFQLLISIGSSVISLTTLSRFICPSLYIESNLRSDSFRDLLIISQWGKTKNASRILIKFVGIVQNYAQLGYC